MLKCYSNNATLDPELQKWFLAECAAMNAYDNISGMEVFKNE